VWRNAVIANGGTVSGSTLVAVSNFCRSIDATAGLRSALLRLNLFCGTGLSACLVPLYRGASRTGTQLGNTTDTNVNFVSGDYSEQGASGGLKADGSTKWLRTGFGTNSLASLHDSHLSFSGTSLETGQAGVFVDFMGVYGGVVDTTFLIQNSQNNFRYAGIGNFTSTNIGFSATETHVIGSRTSSTLLTVYRSGSSIGTNSTTAGNTRGATEIGIFKRGDTAGGGTAGRFRMYSFGNGLTDAQALALSNAVIAFNTALNRA
jgi:hypothetical protein